VSWGLWAPQGETSGGPTSNPTTPEAGEQSGVATAVGPADGPGIVRWDTVTGQVQGWPRSPRRSDR